MVAHTTTNNAPSAAFTRPTAPSVAAEQKPAAKKKPPTSAASLYGPRPTSAASLYGRCPTSDESSVAFCNRTYAGDGTIARKASSSSRSVASLGKSIAGCSLNGMSVTNTDNSNQTPVLGYKADRPIDGSLMFSKVDIWQDSSLNWRASLQLTITELGVALGIDSILDGRISSTDKTVVVFLVGMHPDISHVDSSLAYMLEDIKKVYPHLTSDEQARQFLHQHPRYLAACQNIRDLMAGLEEGATPIFTYRCRITNPLNKEKPSLCVADQLILPSEDRLCNGATVVTSLSGATTHVHYQFKERSVPFGMVNHGGALPQPPCFSSPVRPGLGGALGRVPEEIATPCRDDSSLDTEEEDYVYDDDEYMGYVAPAPYAAPYAASAPQVEDGDDDSSAEQATASRMEEVTPEEWQQFQEYQEFKMMQAQKFHVRRSGLSVSSKTTRGSAERDAKRKTPGPRVFTTAAFGVPASNLASFASVAAGHQQLSPIASGDTNEASTIADKSKKHK
jgi:hypothetical protein